MSFDEEPDGNPHGECAAEIARLKAELAALKRHISEETQAALAELAALKERDAALARDWRAAAIITRALNDYGTTRASDERCIALRECADAIDPEK